MNVVDQAGMNLRAQASDFDRFRLRRYVDELARMGELDTREEPVDLAGINGLRRRRERVDDVDRDRGEVAGALRTKTQDLPDAVRGVEFDVAHLGGRQQHTERRHEQRVCHSAT